MNKNAITAGIKAIVDAADILPMAWPNVTPPSASTYAEFAFVAARREGGTLPGNEILREVGAFQITVAVPEGTGTKAAEDYADQFAALFVESYRFNITGGRIAITKPADIREGFYAEGEWRVPVIFNYMANRT